MRIFSQEISSLKSIDFSTLLRVQLEDRSNSNTAYYILNRLFFLFRLMRAIPLIGEPRLFIYFFFFIVPNCFQSPSLSLQLGQCFVQPSICIYVFWQCPVNASFHLFIYISLGTMRTYRVHILK